MLFSIIIPVYNVEKYLPQCLDSIINQEIREYEIILVDDGSTDSSGEICDIYEKQYDNIMVRHIRNHGVSYARNTGLEYARGKYIWFIDGDDYVEKGSLKKICDYLNGDSKIDLLIFDAYVRDTQNNIKRQITNSKVSSGNYSFYNNKRLIYFNTSLWNRIYSNKIITQNKLKFNENLSIAEDLLFNYMYIIECNDIAYRNDKLYNYIERKNSAMQGGGKEKDVIEAFDYLLEYYTQKSLYDIYRKELEYLIYDQVYLKSIVRISRNVSYNEKDNIDRIRKWVKEKKISSVWLNRYIWKMPLKHIFLLILVKIRFYWLIRLLFKKRDRLIK